MTKETTVFVSDNYPVWICFDCGKKFGKRDYVDHATFHKDECGVCGEHKDCTEPRDFGHIRWEQAKKDMINPDHYKSGTIESIEVIEAFDLDFCLGNVIKYVLRAGKKDDEVQDLSKAKWYLERKINQLKK